MDIQVTQLKNNKFMLKIAGETVLIHEKLGAIVLKIEEYLKMRFLAKEQGGVTGFFEKFGK